MPDVRSQERVRLAAAQAEILGALLAGGPIPKGFDQGRVRACGDSLLSKRLRALHQAWPGLAPALGPQANELARAFAAAVALAEDYGPLADGRAFIEWLCVHPEAPPLPDDLLLQALGLDLRFQRSPRGLRPRRGPLAWRTIRLAQGRLIFGFRCWPFGPRWLPLPGWPKIARQRVADDHKLTR